VKRVSLPWLRPIKTGSLVGGLSSLCRHWIHRRLSRGLRNLLRSDRSQPRRTESLHGHSVQTKLGQLRTRDDVRWGDTNSPRVCSLCCGCCCQRKTGVTRPRVCLEEFACTMLTVSEAASASSTASTTGNDGKRACRPPDRTEEACAGRVGPHYR